MPRFDNEGFNPKKRIDNDSRDRSVPEDENYYGKVNYNFDNSVVDNQDEDNYSYPSYPTNVKTGFKIKTLILILLRQVELKETLKIGKFIPINRKISVLRIKSRTLKIRVNK